MPSLKTLLCCAFALALAALCAAGCRDVSEERYGKKDESTATPSDKLERPRKLLPDVEPLPPNEPVPEPEPEAETPDATTPTETPPADAPEAGEPEAAEPETETEKPTE